MIDLHVHTNMSQWEFVSCGGRQALSRKGPSAPCLCGATTSFSYVLLEPTGRGPWVADGRGDIDVGARVDQTGETGTQSSTWRAMARMLGPIREAMPVPALALESRVETTGSPARMPTIVVVPWLASSQASMVA